MSQQINTTVPAAAAAEALNLLNSYRYKAFIKIADLEQNVAHKIYGARRISTKFGERVVLELQKHQMFLPARFDKLTAEVLEKINIEGNFYLTNQGPAGASYDLIFSQHDVVQSYNMPYLGPNNFFNEY